MIHDVIFTSSLRHQPCLVQPNSYLTYNAPPTVYHIVLALTYCCRAGAEIFCKLLQTYKSLQKILQTFANFWSIYVIHCTCANGISETLTSTSGTNNNP